MKMLLDSTKLIRFIGNVIEFGIWDEPTVEKWKIDNYYALDNAFELVEVETIPIDVVPDKYFYINGEFIVNPNYSNPSKTLEELQVENENLKMQVDELSLVVDGLLS